MDQCLNEIELWVTAMGDIDVKPFIGLSHNIPKWVESLCNSKNEQLILES
jgi:hypothetical protein